MSLSALDLNLLVVLDAVLSERSVARAAKRLHVGPSAVSNALARLRAALGDPLFVRRGRGVVPTPRALQLAPILAKTLGELDRALHGAAFDPQREARTFTFAIADVGQLVHLPRIAARFRAALPRATLRVVGIDSLVALGGLAGTDVDLAFGVASTAPEIHREAMFAEPTTLVARRGHPLLRARRPSSSAAALLADVGHVAIDMVPGRGSGDDPIAAAFARAGAPRRIAMLVPSFTAAAAVVAATDLVATLPLTLLRVLGPRLGIVGVPAASPARAVTMSLSWHERTDADPAMRFFRDVVRATLGRSPDLRAQRVPPTASPLGTSVGTDASNAPSLAAAKNASRSATSPPSGTRRSRNAGSAPRSTRR